MLNFVSNQVELKAKLVSQMDAASIIDCEAVPWINGGTDIITNPEHFRYVKDLMISLVQVCVLLSGL